MKRVGAETAQAMAEICDISVKSVHNRIIRGIGWIEADELAIRCGFLPWEVWPDWADVDPSGMSALCGRHEDAQVEDNEDMKQQWVDNPFGVEPAAA
jgi:hypothetical protein